MSEKTPESVDFYSGHKTEIEYLGTIWVPDGSPEGIQALRRFSALYLADDSELFVESDYREAVEQLMAVNESATVWPHAHRNSINSDWSYRFSLGSVSVCSFGHQYGTILCNGTRQPYQYFPDMTTKQRKAVPR